MAEIERTRTCFGCGVALPLTKYPTYTAHEFECGKKHPDRIPADLRPLHTRELIRQERSRLAKLAAQKREDERRAKIALPAHVYQWDELCNKITRWEGEPREHEEEWAYHSLLQNGVVVLKTDRHWALETWADNEGHANRKFLDFPPYARMHE
jgi:hypothetical protein